MTVDLNEELEDFANEHGEPHWLVKRRLAALEAAKDFNNFNVDQWEYFPMKAPAKPKLTHEIVDQIEYQDYELGITQFGQSNLDTSIPDELDDEGLLLTDVFTAFRQHPRLIQNNFMSKVIPEDTDQLTSLHTAFFNNGIFLYIPKDCQLTKPIQLNVFQDSIHDQPLVHNVFIVAEEGSQAQVILNAETIGEMSNIASCMVEIIAKANSKLGFTSTNHFSQNTTLYMKQHAHISRDAKVDWNNISDNGGDNYVDTGSMLAGKNAESHINSISKQNDGSKIKINNEIEHRYDQNTGEIEQISFVSDVENASISTITSDKELQSSHVVTGKKNTGISVIKIDTDLVGKYNYSSAAVEEDEFNNEFKRAIQSVSQGIVEN
ncbi:SufD family Fe-S cluster assembly protein [Companilactobacillus mishanensis]|uniref:SufD family Fe-S cluster assembly protein n=1 Tax=Companilactobacillus mishanensis TaxID=2486008 RepID=UPI0012954362|nr:SufD family Fe-S cluster assembly protein [Companilactobacillus mishanensis]MQS88755.1 hypothetical protein [Companilactobacillus mishanensis]